MPATEVMKAMPEARARLMAAPAQLAPMRMAAAVREVLMTKVVAAAREAARMEAELWGVETERVDWEATTAMMVLWVLTAVEAMAAAVVAMEKARAAEAMVGASRVKVEPRAVERVAARKARAVAEAGAWAATVDMRAQAVVAKERAGATGGWMERVAISVRAAKGVAVAEAEETKAKVVLVMVEARAVEVAAMARVAVVMEAEGAGRAMETAGRTVAMVMVEAAEGSVAQAAGVEGMGLEAVVLAEGMMVEAVAATGERMDFGRAAGARVVDLVAVQAVFVASDSGVVTMAVVAAT